MRILHVIPSLSGGGAERQLAYLAAEQARAGLRVEVAYLGEGPDPPQRPDDGIRWHRLPARSSYDPGILLRLLRLVRASRPDLIHTWILSMDVLGGAAALLTRTPWICREPVSGAAYGSAWKHRLRLLLVSRADAIVSNSAAGRRHWEGLRPRVPGYVVRNALPLEAIARARPRDAGCGAFVLYAGRLENEQKNLDHLFEALAAVVAEQPVAALVCGEGPYRGALEAFVARAGLADRIRLKGYVSDVWSYMKSARAFVSVSYREGQPNAVMEAMACGCPLVVSDIPMHREFLDESCARLVDPDDSAAIAAAIAGCLAEPEAARARAKAAQQRAAGFSIDQMASAWARVYAECLERRRARTRAG